MKLIPVNNGKYQAKVSDEDYEKLSRFKWYLAGSGKKYACRQFQLKRYKHYIYMHREIMGNPAQLVDHINGDPLDNRRSNLRLANHHQNGINACLSKANTTGYKNIYFHKSRKKWYVRVRIPGGEKFAGYYDLKSEAITERDKLYKKYHGDYRRKSL